MNKVICIIQARFSSTRLPGKILMRIGDKTLLEYVIDRVRRAKKIDKVVVATTDQKTDDATEKLLRKIGADYFRGSEKDVLDRYWQCSQRYPDYKNIVRVTGDCPLIDPVLIDEVVSFFQKGGFDYASNVCPPTFPDGMDVEVFTRKALEESANNAKLVSEREHVTQYIRNSGRYCLGNYVGKKDFSRYRLTVDNPEDFEVVKFIIENTLPDANYFDYVKFIDGNPNIKAKNAKIQRNEGLAKSLKNDKVVPNEAI